MYFEFTVASKSVLIYCLVCFTSEITRTVNKKELTIFSDRHFIVVHFATIR